ncbi:MAG: hypothetical protein N2053_00500 [Chitinispirillaceae bacterium]|nr:hypothetical protein [Chitinispirillaceae bacterium]
MKAIKVMMGIGVFLTFTYAKNFSSFSLAPAFPITKSKAITLVGYEGDSMITTEKSLGLGWGIGWTFFRRPVKKESEDMLPFGIGGKIGFNHWKRDSTFTQLNYLNMEIIGRWYFLEKKFKFPSALFIQGGVGGVVGEYASFSEPDTLDWKYEPDQPIIINGKWGLSNNIGIGIVWDIIEFLPCVNFTIIEGKLCGWLSLSVGVTF